MKKLQYGVAAALSLVLVACGSSSNNSDAGTDAGMTTDAGTDGGSGTDAGTDGGSPCSTCIDISGTAQAHPLSVAVAGATMSTLDFSNLTVSLADPVAFLTTPSALATMTLDTSGSCGTSANGCAWDFKSVDVSKLSLGLVAVVSDNRMTGQQWITTGTGIASETTIKADEMSHMALTGARAFAVSVGTEAALVAFVNAAKGTTLAAGDLTKGGFMIGNALDATGNPVAGVTVTASGGYTVLYPDATLMMNGTATSSTGLFVLVPPGTLMSPPKDSSGLTSLTLTGSGHTWAGQQAGSAVNTCFVLLILASS